MNNLERANQLVGKAHTNMNQGKPAQAIKTYQEAKELFTKLNDLKGAAGMQHMIGVCYRINNDLGGATQAFKQAIVDYQKAGDTMGPARVARDIGLALIDHDKLSEAEQSLRQSQQELQKLPEGEMRSAELGITLAKLGQLYTLQNRLDEAEKYLIDGLVLIRKTGHAFYELTALLHLSALYFETKHYDRMLANAEAALGLVYEYDMYDKQTRRLAQIYGLMAHGYLNSANQSFAKHFAKKSLDIINNLDENTQGPLRKDVQADELEKLI